MVAMSGGVDSSVAAALLVEEGHEVIGVTFKLFSGESPGLCCGLEGMDDARAVARKLDIRHYVMDFSREFEDHVIDNFVSRYLRGLTPNPCILCNRFIKFGLMLDRARALEIQGIATGHYARIAPGPGGPALYRAVPGAKDQSYVLFCIPPEALSDVLLPIGNHTKETVRSLAARFDLPVVEKEESQDICFVREGTQYGDFVAARAPRDVHPGPIVDSSGTVLGEHRGLVYYTVGQRRGLGIQTGTPLYVIRLVHETNTVVIGREEEIFDDDLSVESIVLHEDIEPATTLDAAVQIRYRHQPAPARVTILENERARVRFAEPQWAVAPGQAAVFYHGDRVIGGGWISNQNKEEG